MKRTLLFAALVAASIFFGTASAAGFTYHGNLQDAGKPANGSYDIELTLYSAQTGGSVVGGPLTIYAVPVRDGSFSTEADFGRLVKSFSQAYVGVKVRSAGSAEFAALDTRTSATPAANTSCPGSWSLDGNAGNLAGSYIGTADTQPLVLRTDAQQVAIADMIGGGTVPRWIGGGSFNTSSGGQGAFIGGGGSNTDSTKKNYVGPFSVIGGGDANQSGIGTTTGRSVVGGGSGNKATADYATVGGGSFNTAITANGTIGGGSGNTVTSGPGGGSQASTVAGGQNNVSAWASAVGGGTGNSATGQASVVVGGNINSTQGFATAVGGGEDNNIYAAFSTIPGGHENIAGAPESLAAGSYARTRISGPVPATIPPGLSASDYTGSNAVSDGGTFMWADSTGNSTNFTSNGGNKFLVLATGGVNFVTARSAAAWVSGVSLAAGGGSWSSISDRNVKTELQDVDSAAILQHVVDLPVSTWRYISQDPSIRHIGPMAQDFYAAFEVGEDERHITQVDEGGVALAAIQGLNQKLEVENTELRGQLEQLANRLTKLEAGKGR